MKPLTLTILLLLALTQTGCKKPFNTETISGFTSALIVEGVLNTAGTTNIYLSRTLDLDDKVVVRPELKATVQVLAENNAAITLNEKGSGLYTIPQLSLNNSLKYRLKIKTSSGSEYVSDPLDVRTTPPIGNFYWEREPGGVGIYIDTQDSQNKTKYYQWEFEEDWEIRSIDFSIYRAFSLPTGGVLIVGRDPKETALMYTCYKKQQSNSIDIFSTAKLSNDIVAKHPIIFIPNNSEKLGVKYSINVKQYSITSQAFEYLTMMKRNTEQLGSFFDAQPSELIGNIRNIADANDVAIGFVIIAPVLEKRIFIERAQLQNWGFILSCPTIRAVNHPDSLAVAFSGGSNIPQYPGQNDAGTNVWSGTTQNCLDCRTRGGNNVKPSFW